MDRSTREPSPVSAWSSPAAPPDLGEGTREPGRLLEALFVLEPQRPLRSMPGRETFLWPGREELVVKRFRGGEARDFWFERLRGEVRSPGRREGENLAALAAAGLPVPGVLAWAEERDAARHPRRGGRSALVMDRVPFEESLRARLERGAGEPAPGALLELVSRLHAAGWIHRDLYTQHVAVRPDGSLVLLDVGRARRPRTTGVRWLVKDLAALHMSSAHAVTPRSALGFLRGWLRAVRPIEADRGGIRRWARAVLAKSARMSAHRPRYLDPGDPIDAPLLEPRP